MSIKSDKKLSSFKIKSLTFAIVSLLSINTHVFAASGDVVGSEFRVNTITAEEKLEPAIDSNDSGLSVVTWASRNQATLNGGFDIYAQQFDTDGNKVGNEFLVNVPGVGDKNTPDVALDDNGNFVIVWRSNDPGGTLFDIFGQLYNTSGTKVGSEFLINTTMVDDQEKPSVGMDAEGNFVVTWQSFDATNDYDIFAKKYDAQGNMLIGEFLVHTASTSGIQINPSVAMNSDGDFVIAWQTGNSFVSDISAQRYESTGSQIGAEFTVNSGTNNDQLNPSVAINNMGEFTIAWESLGHEPVSSSGSTQYGVYLRQFDTDGNRIGSLDTLVNSEVVNDQKNTSIAMDGDGDFVVTWQSEEQTAAVDGTEDIFAQRFTSDGNKVGTEFQVNSEIEDNQTNPVVAMDANGHFMIAWQSNNQVPGGVIDIFAQRYDGKEANTTSTASGSSGGGGGGGGSFGWLILLFTPLLLRRKTQ